MTLEREVMLLNVLIEMSNGVFHRIKVGYKTCSPEISSFYHFLLYEISRSRDLHQPNYFFRDVIEPFMVLFMNQKMKHTIQNPLKTYLAF